MPSRARKWNRMALRNVLVLAMKLHSRFPSSLFMTFYWRRLKVTKCAFNRINKRVAISSNEFQFFVAFCHRSAFISLSLWQCCQTCWKIELEDAIDINRKLKRSVSNHSDWWDWDDGDKEKLIEKCAQSWKFLWMSRNNIIGWWKLIRSSWTGFKLFKYKSFSKNLVFNNTLFLNLLQVFLKKFF